MNKILGLLIIASLGVSCSKSVEEFKEQALPLSTGLSIAPAATTSNSTDPVATPTEPSGGSTTTTPPSTGVTSYTCPAVSDTLPPFPSNSTTFDDSNSSAVDVTIDNDKAHVSGPWTRSTVISGYHSRDYLFSRLDSEVKAIISWTWKPSSKGYYYVYENHSADANRSMATDFKISTTASKTFISKKLDQRYKGGTWNKLTTVWIAENAEATVSTANRVEAGTDGTKIDRGVVIADAVRFVKVQGAKYQASANEGSKVTLTCPSAHRPEIIMGHYYDPNNTSKRCVFDSSEYTGGSSFLVGNHLCGDPSWTVTKKATVEYTCRPVVSSAQ